MLTSMALFAALTMSPGQAGGLTLSNPRITYGELGSTRPDNKLQPGDIFFLSFDIDGIKVNEAGRVKYGMAMEVTDATGKSIFKQMPVERDDFLPLGGTKLPARAFVSVGVDQPAGEYTCKVTVTDMSDKDKPVAKSLEQKFQVQARDPAETALGRVMGLTAHPAFEPKNPNRLRALVSTFANSNPARFHDPSGAGYRFLADQILAVDRFNPMTAARLIDPLDGWRRYRPELGALMKAELERIAGAEGLSKNVLEKAARALDETD